MIDRHVKILSQKNLEARRENLKKILTQENINFSAENFSDGTNFLFGDGKEFLLTAHYDNYKNSFGANDNMAAVCILIELAKKNLPVTFALLDGEEDNHTGAKFFAETHDLKKFSGIINLDLCGYGDSIILHPKGRGLERFFSQEILKKHNAQLVKFLPENDGNFFRKYRVPVLNLSIIPKWDVQYLKALASFGERLLGMPPEYYLILSQMEISQTMHGGEKDNPAFIQADAMQKIYDFLFDALTKNYIHEKFSLKKFFRRFF